MAMKPKASSQGEELTLRIKGEAVTPEDFKKAVQAFVELLKDVTEDTSKGGKMPQWNMSVSEGSGALVARVVPDIETREVAREVVKRVKVGFARIERGRFDSADLPPMALHAAQELVSLPGLSIGNGALGVQKSSIGSIEGRLSTIGERGVFQFVVFDALSDRAVDCFLAADKFPEAHAAFGRRVSVFGTIQHDKDGRALSIQVERIRILKDLPDLPPIAYFKGMLKTA
jgi:hypothetical protein